MDAGLFLELIEFDVSYTSYDVEVENGLLLCDVIQSWKMILGGHGSHGKFLGKKCENHVRVSDNVRYWMLL